MRKTNVSHLLSIALLTSLGVLGCNLTTLLAQPTQNPEQTPETPSDASVTASPTLMPIPQPGTKIEEGDQALFNGDWDRAIAAYQAARENEDADVQSAALLGMARTHYAKGEFNLALSELTELITQFPQSQDRAHAFFILGETFFALSNHSEAASAFQEYLTIRPGLIDQYVYERKGDALIAAGSVNEAIGAYQSALGSESASGNLDIEIKIADAYFGVNDFSTAIIGYQDVLAQSGNDFTKAHMLRKIGESYLALDDTPNAFNAFHEAVNHYPLSYDSYLSLVYLIDAGEGVNELNRGIINYNIGQYGLAVTALDNHLNNTPEHDDTAHFYKGLSLLNTSQYAAAIAQFQELIDDHPDGRFYSAAFDELAYTHYFYLDDYPTGIGKYIEFADSAPAHPDAPKLLFFAARAAETNGQLSEAAVIWRRIGTDYSFSDYGFDSYFLAGITEFRLRNFAAAESDFQSTLALARTNEEKSQAYFWIGKAQAAANNNSGAATNWQQASTLDPTGYYSELAMLKLEGRNPFNSHSERNFTFDAEREKLEAQAWMVAIFGIPADTNFSAAALQSDPRFVRGNELWSLGLYEDARLEFESLRNSVSNDALQTYRLANHLLDIGLYRSGIIAARQVLTLANLSDAQTLTAPIYFNRMRFGLYFDELIFPAAEAYSFDPLFLYSVIRQESLFEGFVTSSAGARGLMQIVPATGDQIFSRSGWPPDYTSSDLYRPVVNVTYGADYLASQRNLFGDNPFVILSAYNGGPGSASAWAQLAPDDAELYVEIVRFSETRNYLRSVFELFILYEEIYATALN